MVVSSSNWIHGSSWHSLTKELFKLSSGDIYNQVLQKASLDGYATESSSENNKSTRGLLGFLSMLVVWEID